MTILSSLFLFTALANPLPAEKNAAADAYLQCIALVEGLNVAKDYDKAFPLCKLAAEAGIVDAQFNLAVMYINGEGTKASDEEALKWYQSAAEQGHKQARINANKILIDKGSLPELRKARDLARKDLQQSDKEILFYYGLLFSKLAKTDAEHKEVITVFKKASDLGHAAASFNLAIHYHFKMPEKTKNMAEAIKYYEIASNHGIGPASTNLGHCYHDGLGVKEDETKMWSYFQLGAKQGDTLSNLAIARLYYDGSHPKVAAKDFKKAFDNFQIAAGSNHPEALKFLSRMYRDGKGIQRDITRSKELYHKYEMLKNKS